MNKDLKKLLIDRGLRQADLAKRLGVSRQAISFVINGVNESCKLRLRIAHVLELTYEDVWGRMSDEVFQK